MAAKSKKRTTVAKKASAKTATHVKRGGASVACSVAGRTILAPTKPSTLGRARIKAAVVKVYGKKSA